MILSSRQDQKRIEDLSVKFADLVNDQNVSVAEVLSVCVAAAASAVAFIQCKACREVASRSTIKNMTSCMDDAVRLGAPDHPDHQHLH